MIEDLAGTAAMVLSTMWFGNCALARCSMRQAAYGYTLVIRGRDSPVGMASTWRQSNTGCHNPVLVARCWLT